MDTNIFSKPFDLDDQAIQWVARTHASLSLEEKLGQIVLPLCLDLSKPNLDRLLQLKPGGIFRMTSHPPEALRESAEYLQQHSAIPLLMSGDLEFGQGSSIGGARGTAFPNQLGIAATNQPEWAARMGRVAAREGRYCGYNWSFTPVVDIDFNFKSPIVNTRSFGSDPERVKAMSLAYIRAMQAEGMAACAKHWPGDGVDDRDQHLVTSVNRLDMQTWWATFGQLYQALIDAGIKTVMSAHIALPAYRGEVEDALRPATLSKALNLGLLRGELGFNGLIVSDASEMAGFSSQGRREELVPLCIENGCDILLFPRQLERDLEYLRQGLERGILSQRRLDEAVLRVLALKASLGLHGNVALPKEESALYATAEHREWEQGCAEQIITLVKDTQGLLPLSQKHRRLLVITPPKRRGPFGPLPDLQVPEYLKQLGFEVTLYTPDTIVEPEYYDALIYLVAEEGVLVKASLHLRWEKLHGNVFRAMERHWDVLPTVFVSLGTPYYLYEVPQCKTFVNAYSPAVPVQKALVKALTGQIPFRGVSPVNPFAGLEKEANWVDINRVRASST